MLHVDYAVDPKIQGNITLRTSKPVGSEALIPLLESALASVDAAIVAKNGGYRIVPIGDARSNAPLTGVGSPGETPKGFATEVVGLKNASAREIARLLEQLLGKGAVLGTDLARNQVILSGTAQDRQAARAMIERFDVDALAGLNFQVFKLENVDADSLLAELEKVFQPPIDIIGSRVRLVPLPRLRSLLAVAADRADLARIEPWIRRLDVGAGGKPKIYSYSVQNGRARDLAGSLQRVLGSGGGGLATTTILQPAAPASSGSGSSGQRDSGTSQGASAAPSSSSYGTESSGSLGDGLRIVPNEETNILLIYATGEQYDLVREVLDKIDRPVPQVLIEATLAEVTLNNDLSLGVDWSIFSNASTFTLSNTASAAPASVFPGFSYSYIGSTAQVVLNTLQSKSNVRVLSQPKLIVLNNQPATLQVGDQVPIVVQQSQSTAAPGAPVVNTVELRDTGVILKVTPRVNDSNTITLDISQEVSDVARTTTSGINSPTIQQRRFSSTVATTSGQMVALGGLIRDTTTRQKQGVPFLSQIPILGAAFGKQTDQGSRTELIVLITPTVIRAPQDAQGIANGLIDGLDLLKPALRPPSRKAANAAPPKK
jgi:general secretion pathway protein D